MAEAVLFHIAGELINKLGSQIVQEIGLWWNVEDELAKLRSTLSTIQAVLLDAEEQQPRSHQVRDWLGKLREVVYDADDLLDDFSTEALHRQLMTGNKMGKEVRIFFSSSNKLVYGLRMGHKVKAIRRRLDEIAAERKFHLENRLEEKSCTSKERESTHSFVRAEEVLGRDEDRKEIVNILLNSEQDILIVPIVGMGGLGKTTLAQLVYNDEAVKTHFELRMWVCVSDPFNVRIIVGKMIKSARNSDLENLEMDQLQNCLRKEIDGKRYLLVLDDVWNEDRKRWLDLEGLLMGGAKGSRIVITTRGEKVAKATGASLQYVLKGLTEEKACELFEQIAFKGRQKPVSEAFMEIEKKIIRKCFGVPLAIKTVGALLCLKDPEIEWSSFEQDELSEITQQDNDILPTLKLSFDYLPSHLKDCFAYCRLFPKDYEIHVPTLIYLWMAQGFIESSNKKQHLEDIGLQYFKELLSRSFFQEVTEFVWGDIKYCKMHDLMHDLAILVGGKESIMLKSNDESLYGKAHHISFDFNIDSSWRTPSPFLERNKIRTFLLPRQRWGVDINCVHEVSYNSLLSNSRCLRTLDFHDLNLEGVPESIGKLTHLRYLDLSWNMRIECLPNCITKLQNMQVLRLSRCSNLKRLPPKIKKLVNLRCLETSGCDKLSYMPQGIGQLSFLQRLDRFIVDKRHGANGKPGAGLSEMNGLNNLRGICIENLGYLKDGAEECRAANLQAKQHLRSLRLGWNGRGDDDSDRASDEEISMEWLQPHHHLQDLYVMWYKGVMFPSWLSSLTNLVNLHLDKCINCKHLPPLYRLYCLEYLAIEHASGMEYIDNNDINWAGTSGEEGEANNSFFPSLKHLVLQNCPNLKGWWRRRDNKDRERELPIFPCLSMLKICDCPMLTYMPSFPSVEGRLLWTNNSGKPLQRTMKMTCSTSSSLPLPLSKLKTLWLDGIQDLEYLPAEGLRSLTALRSFDIKLCSQLITLPGEGFRGLTCLRYLTIRSCERLNSLSGVFQHLTVLRKLVINNCEELDLSDLGEMQFRSLRNLTSLAIGGLPKLVCLPESLQHVVSLRKLVIESCPNLTSLPVGLCCLISLENLAILGCPHLSETCQKDTGTEWHKIGHIPRIIIDSEIIQDL